MPNCFDNIVFGGAKDGFILTDKYIYAHNIWGKTEFRSIVEKPAGMLR